MAKGRSFVVKLLSCPQLFAGLVLCVLVASASMACSQPAPGDRVSLWFVSPDGSASSRFSMEIANTEAQRRRGLMYRKSIGEREGMIFVFPNETEHSFWMKNTYIPLDMVFVDANWKVAGVLENVPPLNEESRSVNKPSQYVLEFAAGSMKPLGVVPGSAVKLDGTLPSPQ